MSGKKIIFLLLLYGQFVMAGSKNEPVTAVTINAVAGLRYDLPRFKVKPGAQVKLTFTNQDDMSHNLVFTKPGAREEIVNTALNLGDQGPAMNFIPESNKVLWSIAILAPGETKTITFTVPDSVGIFPYVCTYPGHGFVMYGAMYVTNDAMPPVQNDLNISGLSRTEEKNKIGGNAMDTAPNKHVHTSTAPEMQHPYKPVAPYLYRVFIDDASPAAIAVNLPHQISYCWDAGSCRLRYAWEGEFLDNTDFWKGHKDGNAKILGHVFYRDKTEFPLRIGDFEQIPVVRFKGYKLVNRFPEFHYFLNKTEIFEMIKPQEDGTGLIRTFTIAETGEDVWFTFDSDDGVEYTTLKGKQIKGRIKLLSGKSHPFSVIMTKKKDLKL